jgi:hypothetical protein
VNGFLGLKKGYSFSGTARFGPAQLLDGLQPVLDGLQAIEDRLLGAVEAIKGAESDSADIVISPHA